MEKNKTKRILSSLLWNVCCRKFIKVLYSACTLSVRISISPWLHFHDNDFFFPPIFMLYKPLCHSYFQYFLALLFLSSSDYIYVGVLNSCYFLPIWSWRVYPFLDCCTSVLSTFKYFCVHFHLEGNISPPVFLVSFHSNFIDCSEYRKLNIPHF